MPECYIIGGANGSGKTTFAREFLPHWANCIHFINPDLIAGGLSPFDPARAMMRAGRLVIEEIDSRARSGEDFGFETTLSGRTYARTIDRLREMGYLVHLFYLWVPDVDLALSRIEDRVSKGGHYVPDDDVRRRYQRSLTNLLERYRPRVNSLHFFDNSANTPHLVFRDRLEVTTIFDPELFSRIMNTL